MKYIGRFLGWILLGINLCMVVLLLVCAYSPYIDPVAHPVWSCAGLAFPAFLIVNLLFLVFWLVIYRKYALLSFLGLVCSIGAIRTYFPVNVFRSSPCRRCHAGAADVRSLRKLRGCSGSPSPQDSCRGR